MNRLFLAAGVTSLVVLGSVALGAQFNKPSRFGQPNQIPQGGAVFIPPAAAGWIASKETPEALARQADSALGALKNAGCMSKTLFSGKDGSGTSQCEVVIKDSSMFRVEFPAVVLAEVKKGTTAPVVTKDFLVGNGKRMALWISGKGVVEDLPLSVAKYPSQVSLSKWPLEFGKVMFSAIRGGHPFGELVAAARQQGSGVALSVKEKSFYYRGAVTHQKKLVIEKVGKAKGPSLKIDITIDATQGLPVTILTTGTPKGRPDMNLAWSATWARTKSGKIDPGYFAIPNVNKVATK